MDRRATSTRPRLLGADSWFLVVCTGLAAVLAIWITWGIWQPGIPVGDDSAAHVVRATYAFDHILPTRLDSWQTSFGLGYQQFLFLGPVFTLVIGLFKVLSLGTMSTLDAYKATVVTSFALLPVAVAFAAWAFGLGKRAAGIAALLSLCVSSVFGGAGIAGTFQSGLVPQQLGSVWLFLAFGGVVLIIRQPSRRRVLFTGIAAAVLVATHPIATIILGFLGTATLIAAGIEWLLVKRATVRPLLGAWARRLGTEADAGAGTMIGPQSSPGAELLSLGVKRLLALAAAAAVAAGLAAWLLLPLADHPELRGQNSAWGDLALSQQLANMWKGEFVLRPMVGMLAVAGMVFMAVLAVAGRRMALTLLLTPIIYLMLGRIFVNVTPDNAVAIQLTNRSFADVAIIALMPLAALLAAPRTVVSRAIATAFGTQLSPHRLYAIADAIVPILVATAIVILPPHLGRESVRSVRPTAPLAAAAEQLTRVVPPNGRFATQRDFPREYQLTGMSHPDLWMAAVTGHDTLNIFNLESSTVFEPVYETESLTSQPPAAKAAVLARLGITHLLLINTANAGTIRTSPAFHEIWSEGTMAILEVVPPAGQPSPASKVSTAKPATANLTEIDPEHLVLDVTASAATTASIAVAWSPRWHITVDGQPRPTLATTDHLLSVELPAGTSRVELVYAPDASDAVGRVITLASIVGVGYMLWIGRRDRRRRTSTSTGNERSDRETQKRGRGGDELADGEDGAATDLVRATTDP